MLAFKMLTVRFFPKKYFRFLHFKGALHTVQSKMEHNNMSGTGVWAPSFILAASTQGV